MRWLGGHFFGIFFLVLGVIILLNNVFNLNIHGFKVIIGILVIFIGFSIIFSDFGIRDHRNIIFDNNRKIKAVNGAGEYNIIFSSGTIDLSSIQLEKNITKVKVNAIFGAGEVILNSQIPTIIKASTAFGAIDLPNRSSIHFATQEINLNNPSAQGQHLEVEVSAVFGSLEVVSVP